ncbi:MAG TPA: histidine phosphatase family protein [Gaiellaceae bacterium]|nr:histidine phosphatase family protein [Gaiellaceae bacterium]
MRTAILARHAESEFSVRGAMNGDPGLAGALTDEGVEQARLLGEALRGDPIDLCVTTEFERTKQTADLALEGRDVPRLVVPELNDIRVGDFEGGLLETYRAWARERSPVEVPPGGGESRAQAAERYARGFRIVVARPEDVILVVTHGLPIRYLMLAIEGSEPRPVVESVDYATPYRISRVDLEHALERIELWVRDPIWTRVP